MFLQKEDREVVQDPKVDTNPVTSEELMAAMDSNSDETPTVSRRQSAIGNSESKPEFVITSGQARTAQVTPKQVTGSSGASSGSEAKLLPDPISLAPSNNAAATTAIKLRLASLPQRTPRIVRH